MSIYMYPTKNLDNLVHSIPADKGVHPHFSDDIFINLFFGVNFYLHYSKKLRG